MIAALVRTDKNYSAEDPFRQWKISYVEATFADLRRGRVSLWEQRSALRSLRSQGKEYVTEARVFEAIDEQRRIVSSASSQTMGASRKGEALKELAPHVLGEMPESAPANGFSSHLSRLWITTSRPLSSMSSCCNCDALAAITSATGRERTGSVRRCCQN